MFFLISMVIFGTIGLLVRFIGLSSGEIALYRAVMAAILVGGYMLFSKKRIRFGELGRDIPILLLSGGAMGDRKSVV